MRQTFVYCLLGLAWSASPIAIFNSAAEDDLVEPKLATLVEMKLAGADAGAVANAFLKDFKVQSPGGFSLENGKLTLQPDEGKPFSVLRPIAAGPVARWRIAIAPPGADAKPGPAMTKIGVVLASRQLAVLIVQRGDDKMDANDAPGDQVELMLQSADGKTQTLTTERLKADETSGVWELAYHHGYVRAFQGGKLKAEALADVNPNTSPVVGIFIEQQDGPATLVSLALLGSETAGAAPSAEKREAIRAAQLANLKTANAFAAGNLDEARVAAEENVILWRKATGEHSADAANAAFNLAAIVKAQKDAARALAACKMVADARQAALGPKHPLTALALLDLARAHAEQDDLAAARPLAAAAAKVLAKSHGQEHALVIEAKKLAAP
jgi:hypothetical protein